MREEYLKLKLLLISNQRNIMEQLAKFTDVITFTDESRKYMDLLTMCSRDINKRINYIEYRLAEIKKMEDEGA